MSHYKSIITSADGSSYDRLYATEEEALRDGERELVTTGIPVDGPYFVETTIEVNNEED